jgi:outer membrane protein assembly factor BamD (BamD/ComL family)
VATSNRLGFTVEEPQGPDGEILAAARDEPFMLAYLGSQESLGKVRQLVEKHPSSRYLHLARLRILEGRHQLPDRELDEATRDRLVRTDRSGLAINRHARRQRVLEELLAVPDWGPFEEEALALAIEAAEAADASDLARESREKLLRKYPRSLAAQRLREDEAAEQDDDE